MKNKYSLIISIFLMTLVAMPIMDATFFTIYANKLNSTEGWVEHLNLLTANETGIQLTSESILPDTAISQFIIPDFFMNKPLNQTFLSYLGATMVIVNFTSTPLDNHTQGSDHDQQGGLINPSTGRAGTGFNEDIAGNDIKIACGQSTYASAVTALAFYSTGFFYNSSIAMNYTLGLSNYSIGRADADIDLFNGNGTCSSFLNTNTPGMNITLEAAKSDVAGIVMRDLLIQADLDADYFRTYTLNPTHSGMLSSSVNTTINFSSPILVNATATLYGIESQLCTDCQDFEGIAGSGRGETNLTINYTFFRTGELFSKTENFLITNYYTVSPFNNQYFEDNELILVNFSAEMEVNATAIIDGNETALCTNCRDFESTLSTTNGRHQLLMNFTNATNEILENLTFFSNIVIENCSIDPVTFRSLNFSIYDELTSSLLNASIEYQLQGWFTNPSSGVFLGENLNESGINTANFGICTYADVSNRELTSDYTIKFSTPSYETRIFQVAGELLNNLTKNIPLYLLLSTQANTVTVHVTDENDNVIPGVVIAEAHKLDIGNNTFRLVESKQTDFEGQTVMELDTDDELYQFIIKQNGNVIHTSPTFEITTTELFFRIPLGSSVTGEAISVNNFNRTLVKDNLTRMFNATWNDASTGLLGNICLQVEELSIFNQTLVNNECTTNTTGLLTFTIGGTSTSSFIAKLVLILNNGNEYILETESLDYRQTADKFGREGLMWGVLLLIFVCMLGLGAGTELNNPIIYVMGALMLLVIANIFKLTIVGLIGILIIGAVVLYYINKK